MCCGGGFPGDASGKEPACQNRRRKRCRFNPRVGKIPWRRAWQSTPVFLPGESHGQRSLAGYGPQGHRVGYDRNDLTHTQKLYTPFPFKSYWRDFSLVVKLSLKGSWERVFITDSHGSAKNKEFYCYGNGGRWILRITHDLHRSHHV